MLMCKKNEIKFNVSLNEILDSHVCRILKPIVERLGIPDKIKFIVEGRKIIVKLNVK